MTAPLHIVRSNKSRPQRAQFWQRTCDILQKHSVNVQYQHFPRKTGLNTTGHRQLECLRLLATRCASTPARAAYPYLCRTNTALLTNVRALRTRLPRRLRSRLADSGTARSSGSYIGGPHAKFSQIRTSGLTPSLGMRRIRASSVPLNLASSLGGLLGTTWRRTRFGRKARLIWARKAAVAGSWGSPVTINCGRVRRRVGRVSWRYEAGRTHLAHAVLGEHGAAQHGGERVGCLDEELRGRMEDAFGFRGVVDVPVLCDVCQATQVGERDRRRAWFRAVLVCAISHMSGVEVQRSRLTYLVVFESHEDVFVGSGRKIPAVLFVIEQLVLFLL